MAKTWWKVGRPTAKTEAVVKILEDCFKMDASVSEACAEAKICRRLYYEWMEKDKEFNNRMTWAQKYPSMLMKKVLFKTAMSDNEAIAQKGAIEFLKRRDNRYKDKLEANVDAEVESNQNVNVKDMSLKDMEAYRKKLLGLK